MYKVKKEIKIINVLRLCLILLLFGLIMSIYGIIGRLFFTPVYYLAKEKFKLRVYSLAMYSWSRLLIWLSKKILGLKFIIRGRFPEDTNYLILSNHQSLVDIPLILSRIKYPASLFVLKKSLKWGYPALSPFVRLNKFPFVDFSKGLKRSLVFTLELMAQRINAGYNGIIFPEGSREFDGELLNFKIGGIKFIIKETNVPIVPVTIEGLWKSATLPDFFRYLPDSEVHLIIGERISPETYKKNDDYMQLLLEVKNTIKANLDEVRKKTY